MKNWNWVFGLLIVVGSFFPLHTKACSLEISVPELGLEIRQTSLGAKRDIAACTYIITRSVMSGPFMGQLGKIKQFQDADGFGDDAEINLYDYCVEQAQMATNCKKK